MFTMPGLHPRVSIYPYSLPSRSRLVGQRAVPSLRYCLASLLFIGVFTIDAVAGFVTARSEYAGVDPLYVAVADLNGDGVPDVAVLDYDTAPGHACSVSVLLGNGDGSFRAPQSYVVGTFARSMAVGDFNGDGIPDLAVSNGGDGTVSVLLGTGDGTFRAANYIAVGAPSGVAVADFNGDGFADLAVASYNGVDDNGSVSIFLSQGDGTFQPALNYAVGASPFAVSVGDFNGDGFADLVVSNSNSAQLQSGSVSILLGNGDGTFLAAVNYPVGIDPKALAVSDFNGDRRLDIVVANLSVTAAGSTVSVLLGNGDGTFLAALDCPTFPAANDSPPYYCTLAAADFNGDGRVDLAITSQFGVSIWLGLGDGSFQAGPNYNVGIGSAVAADINQDGRADLVVTNHGANAISIALGRGDGTFQAAPGYPTGLGYAASVAVGDFNGDGILDLAVADNEYFRVGSVSVWLGNTDGSFRNGGNVPAETAPVGVTVADLNGDGKPDLLITNYFQGNAAAHDPRASGVKVWLGNCQGGFTDALTYKSDLGTYALAIGDFNGDGVPDVVVTNYGWLNEPGNTVTILLGNGDGTFRTGPSYKVQEQPSSVMVADVNGDGQPDLAVAANGDVSVLLGNGDGTFQAAHNHHIGVGALHSLVVADFNGDGQLDLGVWEEGVQGTVHLLLGNGDGSFQGGASYAAGSAISSTSVGLAAGDFNGDGILDLAVTDFAGGSVSVLLGRGDGTFAPAQNFPAGSPLASLAVGDFNGDGNLDMAVASASTVTILINDGHWPP